MGEGVGEGLGGGGCSSEGEWVGGPEAPTSPGMYKNNALVPGHGTNSKIFREPPNACFSDRRKMSYFPICVFAAGRKLNFVQFYLYMHTLFCFLCCEHNII